MTILLGSLQLTLSLARVTPDAAQIEQELAWRAVGAEVERVRLTGEALAKSYGFRG